MPFSLVRERERSCSQLFRSASLFFPFATSPPSTLSLSLSRTSWAALDEALSPQTSAAAAAGAREHAFCIIGREKERRRREMEMMRCSAHKHTFHLTLSRLMLTLIDLLLRCRSFSLPSQQHLRLQHDCHTRLLPSFCPLRLLFKRSPHLISFYLILTHSFLFSALLFLSRWTDDTAHLAHRPSFMHMHMHNHTHCRLDARRQASSGCDSSLKCHNDGNGGYFCGAFQISW